ncbi:DUF1285 domain-containing protein [Aliikangiella marina]|uniref:DUF1285 domain-containing protein n=1 Tax=Aliikangiella marina TaxID=1712262 RepID=A0A545T147_9GAMM|nr:DUF1285 domain-containing protein [Aliikangiella marina]TQV70938.1 DUF1285 domain-containing protein [Aliikangiella marina]
MVSSESLLKAADSESLPPVESWNPDFCGEIDLRIDRDGSWFYEGTPIGRRKMQILFSRIIKKENHDYFLVTPVEKVKIQVDWMPFTIVDFEQVTPTKGKGELPYYRFTDNCDNQFDLKKSSQWQIDRAEGHPLPIINVRRNLFASFSRSCYYRLVELAEIIEEGEQSHIQLISNGLTFDLGTINQE